MGDEHHQDEWIAEAALTEALGVERSVLRAERPYLGMGEVEVRQKQVFWKKEAAGRVAVKLGISDTFSEKKPAAGPAAHGAERSDATLDGVERLTVFSSPRSDCQGRHYPNPRVIMATRPTGEHVVVRVVDSAKFCPRLRTTKEPMTFLARKAEDAAYWLLVGREPRYVGAW